MKTQMAVGSGVLVRKKKLPGKVRQSASAGSTLAGVMRLQHLRPETLVDIFCATAAQQPQKIALTLIGSAETFTFTDLDQRSNRVAAGLVRRGVKPGDFVGLWCRRSLDLHVALLGILKAGAAYIPFDAETPVERVAACLADCGASLLVSHQALAAETAHLSVAVAPLEELLTTVARPELARRATPDGAAYAIYTSGSTGKPKGIVVTHRNICHYLRAGNEVLGFQAADVVLQQASVAFDLSLEEIFIPYLVGATLKVASADILQQTDRLADVLEAEGITVLDTVPTLLSMLERDVACLRLIVLGGEACPPSLVERFARPGRRLFNTYGPTETTVVATCAELMPGEPVTIGKPIANYTAYVVNEQLQPVPQGETGELLIGGPGVAQGYLNLPELTAQKFIRSPFTGRVAGHAPLLYRTGDAVSVDVQGRLVFQGRIDAQVKIRGYRIELGEIEALLAAQPGVRTAAVGVAQLGAAGDTLVAHVVASGAAAFDVEAVKQALAAQLPSYMVPAHWRLHEDLPTLASGKLDRKALAALPLVLEQATGEQEPPRTLTEHHLLAAAQDILGLPVIDFEADFFTDLGGHSLLAARFVSAVRKIPALSSLALQDVYAQRSLRQIGAALDCRASRTTAAPPDLSFQPVPLRRRFLCGLAQAVALPCIISLVTVQWIGLLLASIYMVREETPLWLEALTLCAVFVALNMGSKLVVIALKWLVIGRSKPGVYPLWGVYYFRLWLMQRVVHLTTHKFLQGTPLMRLYLRALGARIGRDAILQEFEEGAIDLISIGPRASIGTKVKFANVEVIGAKVYVGRIDIGADAHIGNGCVIGHDTRLGQGVELGDLTAIQPGQILGDYERWDGTPARQVGMVKRTDLPAHPELGTCRRVLQTLAYFVVYNLILMVGLLPIFPAFYVLYHLDYFIAGELTYAIQWSMVPVFAWPAALTLVFMSMGVAVLMRWVLMPRRVQPGRYSIFSGFYFRKWALGLTTETLLETLNALYATIFMRNWYRLMGTKIGRGTEISANFAGRYDLIEMGENNFIGDEAIFGDEDVHGGWMILKRLKTGARCFFGNSAVVAQGGVIEDDALLGVKSRLPDDLHLRSGETWFGSPAIKLPTRQKVLLSDNWTYQPALRMRLWRMLFEAMHTSFPTAVLIAIAYITADIIAMPIDDGKATRAVLVFVAAGMVTALVMYALSVLFKWLLMGIYRPLMKPMWSWWAMRTEAVAVFYGGLASKVLLDYLRGTPFLPWLLRLYGTRIGKGTWINCTDITEFDCITIGDYAVLNAQVCPQTHLYEDRVMKVGRIEIGRGATIGTGSTILYDTQIGEFARIGPLTLVMKGESIPPHSHWAGAPAQEMPSAASEPLGAAAEALEKQLAV